MEAFIASAKSDDITRCKAIHLSGALLVSGFCPRLPPWLSDVDKPRFRVDRCGAPSP